MPEKRHGELCVRCSGATLSVLQLIGVFGNETEVPMCGLCAGRLVDHRQDIIEALKGVDWR